MHCLTTLTSAAALAGSAFAFTEHTVAQDVLADSTAAVSVNAVCTQIAHSVSSASEVFWPGMLFLCRMSVTMLNSCWHSRHRRICQRYRPLGSFEHDYLGVLRRAWYCRGRRPNRLYQTPSPCSVAHDVSPSLAANPRCYPHPLRCMFRSAPDYMRRNPTSRRSKAVGTPPIPAFPRRLVYRSRCTASPTLYTTRKRRQSTSARVLSGIRSMRSSRRSESMSLVGVSAASVSLGSVSEEVRV